MANVKEVVDKIIKDNKVAVFSKSYCPFCKKAKDLLKKLGIDFYSIELDLESNGAAIQDYLLEKTGQRTVPNIFVNEEHIGGCDKLFEANESGKLQQIIRA
ncbi:glutaredoxin-1 [Parasitella parasitica]|nr:glutaredoxin-1 [Parasitella parasitica]